MFESVEMLASDKHQDLRFSPSASFAFAKDVSAAPLSVSEIIPASRYYPIVFPSDGGGGPLALLSLQNKHNNFVDDQGKWQVSYIPAHFRRYPFILAPGKAEEAGEGEAGEEKFVVCIDTAAPHFKAELGDPLFTANGEPAEITRKAIEFLQNFQNEVKQCQNISAKFAEQDCFSLKKINLKVGDEVKPAGEFKVPDSGKLPNLSDEVLLEWARSGILALFYAMSFSAANFDRLV